MKNYRIMKYVFIIIIFLVTCIIWYSPNYFEKNTFYNGVDAMFPFSPKDYFKVSAYAWHIQDPFGHPLVFSNTFPITFIIYLVSYLNIPLWILNRLWFFLPTLLIGFSMCYLYRSIFRDRYSYIGCIVAASYIMLFPSVSVPLYQIGLVGCLLVFGALFRMIYYKGINKIKHSIIIGIGISLALITVRSAAIILVLVILLGIILLIFRGFKTMAKQKNTVIFTALMILLINAYCLVPVIGALNIYEPQEFLATEESYQQHITYMRGYHQMRVGSPLWVFKMLSHKGNGLSVYFSNPLIQALTLLFPIYAFIPLLMLSKNLSKLRREKMIIISCLAIFAMFLSTTAYFSLTTELWTLLLSTKIGPAFVLISPGPSQLFFAIFLAILIGVSTEAWWHYIDRSKLSHKPNISIKLFSFMVVMSLILFVYGKAFTYPTPIPLVTTNHIPHARIPDEYYTLRRYLKENIKIGEKILTLPWVEASYVVYKWRPHLHMPDIVNSITFILTVGNNSSYKELFSDIVRLSRNPDEVTGLNHIKNELKVTSTRYIIVHRDYTEDGPHPYGTYGRNSNKIIKVFMNEIQGRKDIRLIFDNECFVLFEYMKSNPFIYAVDYSISQPYVEFREVNPVRYIVDVKAKDSFSLVFGKKFHKEWKAYLKPVNSEQFSANRKNRWEWSALANAWRDKGKKGLELKEHYMVNGYANAWYVPVSQFTSSPVNQFDSLGNKEFEIVIEYMPQMIFEVGVLISGLTLLGCVGYWVGTGIGKKQRKLIKRKGKRLRC